MGNTIEDQYLLPKLKESVSFLLTGISPGGHLDVANIAVKIVRTLE